MPTHRERTIILLVAAVQFVNILDFVMVMPMGPDFAAALGIPSSNLGLIGGSYTAAAAVSGLAGSLFLDRFDRRTALGVAMLGLVFGTAMGAFATGLPSLMLARVVAGIFGGPATSLSLSIVADVVPPERRGKAMGTVFGAFSVAQVIGVPAGLFFAHLFTWRAPFVGVAGIGVVVALTAVFLLPPMRGHLAAVHRSTTTFADLAGQRMVVLSWAMTFLVMMAGFVLIPVISPYIQFNLGYPRERLALPYLVGGCVSLVSLQVAGRATDRVGSFVVGTFGTVLLVAVSAAAFLVFPPLIGPVAIVAFFMFAMAFRNVAYNALTSRVPALGERARFMSIQSSVQHGASALGAFLSSRLLSELPDHRLVGIERAAAVSIGVSLTLPFLLRAVEGGVRRREAARTQALAPEMAAS